MYHEEQYKCHEQHRGLSQLDVARRRTVRRTFRLDGPILVEEVPHDLLALARVLYLDEFYLLRLEELLQVHAAAPFEWIAGELDDVQIRHVLKIARENALQIVALEIQIDQPAQMAECARCDIADRVTAQIQPLETFYVEAVGLN